MSREQLAFRFDEPSNAPYPYTLTCADVLTWAQSYTGPKFHAMLCDPPYHLTSTTDRFGQSSLAKEGHVQAHQHDAPGVINGAYARLATGFMNQRWDGGDLAFQPETWKALAQHLLPGAFIMAFASSRGFHRVMTAMEDAGLRLYPAIFGWLTGQSFPKASRIDTKIDAHGGANIGWFGPWLRQWREEQGISQKDLAQHFPSRTGGLTGCVANWELGLNLPTVEQYNTLVRVLNLPFDNLEAAERAVIGQRITGIGTGNGSVPIMGDGTRDLTAPATPLAQTWAGHRYGGQCLKNSLEPVIVAQVPYAGKPVDSIVTHGAGALWIDGARLSPFKGETIQVGAGKLWSHYRDSTEDRAEAQASHPAGRWPSNFALSHLSLPILRLKGHLPQDTQDAIMRYYAGYTEVITLRAGRNGAVHHGLEVLARDIPDGWLDYFELTGEDLGCVQVGTRQVRGRQDYRNGPGGSTSGFYSRQSQVAQGYRPAGEMYVNQQQHAETPRPGFANANGQETVDAWDCAPQCPVAKLDAQAGERSSGRFVRQKGDPVAPQWRQMEGRQDTQRRGSDASWEATTGSASRFFHVSDWSLDVAEQLAQADPAFYAAKSSRSERDKGLNGQRNIHPTVKPLSLLIWLCRLIAPPAAYAPRRLLIPFAGSMSEACAAVISQQWESITAIEQDPSYCEIGEQRLAYWSRRTVGGV